MFDSPDPPQITLEKPLTYSHSILLFVYYVGLLDFVFQKFYFFRKVVVMSHTILLVQSGLKPETRTYSDYETVNEAMEGLCRIYEEHLKGSNPDKAAITYDISQLFDFMDQMADLSCLVYQRDTSTYSPHNRDWIKEKVYVLLRKQAK